MANFSTNLQIFQKFLNQLTWIKLTQLVVLVCIAGAVFGVYLAREPISDALSQTKISNNAPSTAKLSKKTGDRLSAVVDRYENVIALQVVIVDFQKNTRRIVYTYSDDKNLNELYNAAGQAGDSIIPLFNTDPSNNQRLVELINGEFICTPFTETTGYKILPSAGKYIATSCSAGIPPYYGQFIGAVTVYLKHAPKPEELDQLRILVKSMSSMIYEQELK